ncbi:hypothetical protein FDG95_gp056 [Pectobacterium phage vB_PcaM_CBB]|uniref:Uncharacterized protein n=1 Tax=Pectobacterium phage vB_PcaM_CBB TaxID=2772511 RepID=A0A1L2CUC2_9CAUD|nr:hypothetical protein FDG95_gp056 [Pectobacterium phage vB_PcaM_CBB]AMM43621.1 hypothetical protein CBB_56 [Pectobacterium phage vB_PcaM_CBB]
MKNCELLKEFHEKYYDFISVAETFRTALVNRKSESPHKTCDMGGTCGDYSARFKVYDDSVAIKINGNDFSFTYYAMFDSLTGKNVFFGIDSTSEIEFGKPEINNAFHICGENIDREMQYPIQEDQYFQFLTIAPLSNEEVYKYFMDIDIDHTCDIQLITQDNGVQDFRDLMQNGSVMKELKRHLDLVSAAYRMTNGLVL